MESGETQNQQESEAVPPIESREEKPIFDLQGLIAQRKGGMPTIEAILIMDYQDRKDERAWRRDQKESAPKWDNFAENLAKIVSTEVSRQLQQAKPSEPSEDMKAVIERLGGIERRLSSDEEEKRAKEVIEKATHPLEDALKEKTLEINQLRQGQKELEEKLTSNPPPPKGELDSFIDTKGKLEKLGIGEKKEGTIVLGENGIPIKGEVPAWLVASPYITKNLLSTIESSIDRIATRIGLTSPSSESNQIPASSELIKLPPKPKPQTELQPQPTIEQPTTTPLTPIETAEEEEAEKELIKLPEKPREEEKAAEKTKPKTKKKIQRKDEDEQGTKPKTNTN